jgi:hypothetical protein
MLSACLLYAAHAFSQSQPPNGVPAELMSKLTRGVNITRWFCYGDPHDTAKFGDYLTEGDFANFRRLGVHYVRLCVAPETIDNNGEPDPTNLPLLDAAIDRLEHAGLAVLLDLHDNGQMKLDAEGHDNSGFVHFWAAMARHYLARQEKMTVFEPLNEPVFMNNPSVWYRLQADTVKAIRDVDPARTILVASTKWNGIDTLVDMQPLPEKNLIYSFHCYDPFLFTHQGATWTGDQQKAMRDIPFPSSPEAVEAMITQIPEQHRGAVRDYGNHHFDAAYLRARLALPIQWGAQHRVPVLLGEFGAYPPVSPPDSRGRWFDGMRAAIADLHLPNCLWGYDDGLGLGREKQADGTIKLDPVTLAHLYGG